MTVTRMLWRLPFAVPALLLLAGAVRAEDELSRAAIEQRLTASVKYLASDELEGRGITTAGIDKAAEFLAEHFASIGLDTKRYQGTPFQAFQLGSRLALGPTNALAVSAGGDANLKALTVKVDYTPLSLSGSGKIDLPLAFVGYGITAAKLEYDDYAGIDVAGRAVIVLRNEPRKADPDSPFEGAQLSDFGITSHKVTNALQHGAAAVLLVTDHASLDHAQADDPLKFDRLADFQIKSTAGDRKIPVMHCRRAAIEPLIQAALKSDLAALEQQIDGDLKPRSALLPDCRIKGEVSVVRLGKPLKNVVAVLAGKGPQADETIVLGAHYDHLGTGGSGSLAFSSKRQVHNGADDNGSGTAVLMEVAKQLSLKHGKRPLGRRIVFVAFTAEESGLIGSERYVRDPLIPLQQTVAMLNMDMVGRLRSEKLTIYGTGTATEFDGIVDRLGAKHAFVVTKKPGGMGPSDHASFYQRGIPVLHFFTGLHKQYHRPEDDADLLNVPGMARVSELVTEAVEVLASAEQRPTPRKISGGEEMDGLAEALFGLEQSSADPVATTRPKREGTPYLGISTRKSEDPDQLAGCLVRAVTPKGPADAAGLRSGDLIVKVGAESISDAENLSAVVKKLKAGQSVRIQLRRDGVDLEVEATIGGR